MLHGSARGRLKAVTVAPQESDALECDHARGETPREETVMAAPNPAQEARLRELCSRYELEYDPAHYVVHPPTSSMMPGWAEGWVGGSPGTLFVGVSPEGQSHS